MIDWYEGLHPWNRIVLTGLVALLAIRIASGNLTVELMLGTPVVAATLWALGWALMGAWGRVRRLGHL